MDLELEVTYWSPLSKLGHCLPDLICLDFSNFLLDISLLHSSEQKGSFIHTLEMW